jgi:hypothetical protein
MNNILIITLTLFTLIVTASGGQATQVFSRKPPDEIILDRYSGHCSAK